MSIRRVGRKLAEGLVGLHVSCEAAQSCIHFSANRHTAFEAVDIAQDAVSWSVDISKSFQFRDVYKKKAISYQASVLSYFVGLGL